MKRNLVDGVQNVEVSKKIAPSLDIYEQLEVMEEYTKTHQHYVKADKAIREIRCLEVIYPRLFRKIEDRDLLAGRLDFLPIGFGSVTSVGGVGHYCVFHKLRELKEQFDEPSNKDRIDQLYDYWSIHDVKSIYCNENLTEDTTGRFIDVTYPFMATARLSGMMLDYKKLLKRGINGLMIDIGKLNQNNFLMASTEALVLLKKVIVYHIEMISNEMKSANIGRQKELRLIIDSLSHIKDEAPKTFHQALQLFWMYALCAGAINYGRMDDVLGTYLKNDLDNHRISEEEALSYLESLWLMIENRRTTVNGRIIVGGYGREDEGAADLFTRLALKVAQKTRYVEPQFTLRFNSHTPKDIMDAAYACLASGTTYPTLYNDDVNVEALMYAMRINRKQAVQYVPFGCGEFVIQTKSIGTPNTLLNLLKLQQLVLNEGDDPMDHKRKVGHIYIPKLSEFETYDMFIEKYEEVLDYYIELSVKAQLNSYAVMNKEVSFLFNSILMDDCLSKGKSLLDGGVEIVGGTNEIYGLINASDALYVIKKLVFVDKKYTLEQLNRAALNDYVGDEAVQQELKQLSKYGNDDEEVDKMAVYLYEYVAKRIRKVGHDYGMDYFLAVISNNQTNTDWGLMTDASLDGRNKSVYMNPANNPQGGAALNGPTSMLKSLAKIDAKYHGGSVQNIRFTPGIMINEKAKIQALMSAYFKHGGAQLMVTVVDRGELEDAQIHPEKYPDLIVRVAGYSARFIDLNKDIQAELLSRQLFS